ncbi:Titin-like 19 [Homarus americanus]|uniref:Titin-like 19 n=1 Tax=Homarus americanus TaxID=6706 RepID=A0A8J5TDM5_HOMAM|nr:Titin-like 19 [Homarus americanus]
MFQQGVQRVQGPTQIVPVGLPAGASPPVFEQIFRNARFAQGGDAMFEGKVTGNPKPTVTWTRKGAQIAHGQKYQVTHDETTGVVTLLITAIGPGDEGEYTCTAANQFGEAICTVYIQPEAAFMMQQQRQQQQSMQMSQSKTMMQQQHMSQQSISQQQQQHMMSVQNGLTESFRVDTFEYRLLHEVEFRQTLSVRMTGEAEVEVGAIQGPPQAPQLQQKPRSTKVSDGGNATFTVSVNGYPTPRVIWFKNGTRIQASDKFLMTQSAGQVTLVVKQVNANDNGYYTMLAENNSGCTVASAQLAVVPRGEITNGVPVPEIIRPERIEQQQAPSMAAEPDTGDDSSKTMEPKFVRGPTDREVQEGRMVRFDARVTGRPYPEVFWYINGVLVVDDNTHKVLVNEAGNHSLMINKVSLKDAGILTCVARNKSGEATFQCQLSVLEMQQMVAPKFVERFQQCSVSEGETVVLQCRAVGTPMPVLSWQKDGVTVENTQNVMVQFDQNGASCLQVLSAGAADAGWYQCNAQNSAGSTATRARLHVKTAKAPGPSAPLRPHFPKPTKIIEPEPEPEPELIILRPVERAHHVPKAPEEEQPTEPPKFTHPLRDIDIVEGTRAHFEAKVIPVGDATMNVEWLIDGRPLSASSRATVTYRFGFVALDLLNVIKADAGVYTCRATNVKGQAETSANLRVTERPLIESQTQHPEAMQQISYLEDQSRYQRTVSIDESTTIKPTFVKPLCNLGEVIEGKYAHFEAQLHPVSDPFMKIEWFKDGKHITASSRINVIYNFGYVALNIMQLREEDSGTYTVRATNKAGECSCQASIKVITLSSVTGDLGIPEQAQHIKSVEEMEAYRLQMLQKTSAEMAEAVTAPVFKTQLKDSTAREGGYAHFEARLEPVGDPALKVEWLKDGRPMEASSRVTSFFNFGYVALTVKALIVKDAGTYICRAYNAKGEAQVSCQLTVISKTDQEGESQYEDTVMKMQYLEDSSRYQRTETEDVSAVSIPPKFLGPLKGTNKILEGQKAHFEIRLEPQSDPTMTVEWYFNGQVIMSASRIKTYHDFGYVSLDISDVRQSDAGQYTVVARNSLGQAQMSTVMNVETRSAIDTTSMHEVSLSKTAALEHRHREPQYDIEELTKSKPEFTQLLQDPKPLPEGKNVHLEARLEPMNDPTMKVEWFFNGKPITIGSRFKTYFDFGFVALDILGAYTTDSGEYTCRAENYLGSAHTSACVHIQSTSDIQTDTMHDSAMEQIHYLEDASRNQRTAAEEAEINKEPSFVKSLKNIETVEGTNIHLEARLQPVGDSSMRVEWFFNDQSLKVGHRFRPAYDFDYVALDLLSVYPIDSGIYTCKATNRLGQAVTSASVKVTVDLTLTPFPVAKKDLVFDSEHPESLQKLQYLDDSSRYQRRETMEEVSVKIMPRFLTKLKDVTLREGMHAHFEAKIEPITDPNLHIDWYKNGQPIQMGSRFRLIHDFGYVALDISDLIEEDSGVYTCVATNLMGKDEISANLKCINSSNIVLESQNQTMTMEQLQMLEDRSRYSRTEQVEETTKQAPVFTTSLKNIEILEGQRAHFEVRLIPISDPTMKVEWFHNNTPVKSGSRFTEYNDFGFVALDIMYSYAEDSGTYTCRATNIIGQAVSTCTLVCHTKESILMDTMNQDAMNKISRLESSSRSQRTITTEETTMQAPVFTSPIKDQKLIENAPLHFEARLIPVGDPDLKVEWFKNNIPIQQANRISTMHDFGYVALDMKYVNPEDSGTYTCRATNRLGQAVTTATLMVTSKESLMLESQHTEALEKLRYLEDSSRYTKSSTEETVITQAPKFVVKLSGLTELWEGQSAHVECRLEPYPDPSMKVEWFHNGKSLQVGHRFRTMYDFGFCAMDILQAVAEDSGTYEVRATNRIGTASSSITIQVKPKSDFIIESQHPEAMAQISRLEQKAPTKRPEDAVMIEKPNFGRSLRNQDHLMEGQAIHLEATLTPVNDPTMKVEWFFNGQPIPSGHRFRTTYDFGFVALDILYAYPEDSGTYMCKATNAAGQAVTSCSIGVEGKLQMARRIHGCFVYTGDRPLVRLPQHTPYN